MRFSPLSQSMCDLLSKLFIPAHVDESERLVRFLLSPLHFKNGKLRSNAFNPTKGTPEVSVTRLDYSTENKCKRLAKKVAKKASSTKSPKEFKGFGLITKGIAKICGAKDVVRDPICGNPAHAELLLPGTKENAAISARLQYVQDQLVSKTKVYLDPHPNFRQWDGDSLTY